MEKRLISLRGVSPNVAYWKLLHLATNNNFNKVSSRNGDCLELGHVTVELDYGERLCLLEGRRINPAFAIIEAAWVLEGRNEVAPLKSIIKNYGAYSDDGVTLNGAYGYRLKSHFNKDQISEAVAHLRKYPDSRRVVMSLYSAADLNLESKDIPCNTQIMCTQENGRLNMTVINRSNDLWLGVPYNWFVFRCLQQKMAGELGLIPGLQRHISTCLHLYSNDFDDAKRVVSMNSVQSILDHEKDKIPLNICDFSSDLPALARGEYKSLESEILSKFFKSYDQNKISAKDSETSSLGVKSSDFLDLAIRQWNTSRSLSKLNAMNQNKILTTPDTLTHLTIQRWIFTDSIESLLPKIKAAAENTRPFLDDLLAKKLPYGVKANIAEEQLENVSLQIVLELIFGCLDPMLGNSKIGDQMKLQLQDISKALQLPEKSISGIEMSESDLQTIFGHILN